MDGVIKMVNPDKGFGFITASGQEYFFHRSACEQGGFEDLREGDKVSFTPTKSPKGPRAEAVQPR